MRQTRLTEFVGKAWPKRIMVPCYWEAITDHENDAKAQISGHMTVYNNPYDFVAYFQIQADFNGRNWCSYQITVRNFS